MATVGEIATSYFDALARQDLYARTAVCKPGGVDRIVGDQELKAPDDIRRYFGELFAAFPDFALEVVEVTAVADGVWLIRGGFPLRTMNVYLLEEPQRGVTVFDAGIDGMAPRIAASTAGLGGIKRVVLGHADPDHRGAAPGLAGFRVVELPSHAPGQVGLFRESDRLALVSDTIYTLDIQTGHQGGPRIPHPAFDESTERASASIRKLAGLEPAVVWAGHAEPVTRDDAGQLNAAAAALP